MGKITIYFDDELEKQIEEASDSANVSKSRWIVNVVRKHLDEQWPAEVRDAAGSWSDFPALEQLRAGV